MCWVSSSPSARVCGYRVREVFLIFRASAPRLGSKSYISTSDLTHERGSYWKTDWIRRGAWLTVQVLLSWNTGCFVAYPVRLSHNGKPNLTGYATRVTTCVIIVKSEQRYDVSYPLAGWRSDPPYGTTTQQASVDQETRGTLLFALSLFGSLVHPSEFFQNPISEALMQESPFYQSSVKAPCFSLGM